MDNQPTQTEPPVQPEEKIPYQAPTQTPPPSGKRKLNWKGFVIALIAVGLLDWGALTLIRSDNNSTPAGKPTPPRLSHTPTRMQPTVTIPSNATPSAVIKK